MRKIILSAIFLILPLFALEAQVPDDIHSQAVDTTDDGLDPIAVTVNNARVIDTLDTDDKFVKILIYDNYTWAFYDLGKPVIDTCGFYDGWDSEKIHAFKGMPLDSLPDEVDLRLVDEVHPFCLPISGPLRSKFHYRGYRPHQGVDIGLAVGDTIRAAFDGIVRYSDSGRITGGYGGLVIIRHNNSLETYYAHMSKRLVQVDEIVRAGEAIGLGGSTGHSTGPHLHFETRYYGKPFDPLRIVDFESGTLRDSVFCLKKHYFSIYSHYGMSDSESQVASTKVPPKHIYYKVKKGDSLSKIAKKYGTTVQKICKLNKISSKKPLQPGQRLIVR